MMTKELDNQLSAANEMVNLMQERHSIRMFDETRTIPEATFAAILETMRMSPASYGLLNIRLLVLPRSKFRNQLNEIFYQQKNFITASHFVILLADNGEQIKHHTVLETANAIFGPVASTSKQLYIENFNNAYEARFWNQPEMATAYSAEQAYIVGGVATVTAAACGVDTCMMGGYDSNKLYEVLRRKNLIAPYQLPVLTMAFGYADPNVPVKGKVRLPFTKFVTTVAK